MSNKSNLMKRIPAGLGADSRETTEGALSSMRTAPIWTQPVRTAVYSTAMNSHAACTVATQ